MRGNKMVKVTYPFKAEFSDERVVATAHEMWRQGCTEDLAENVNDAVEIINNTGEMICRLTNDEK